MTYEQLENNYKTKKEKLDAMLELKTKEEILAFPPNRMDPRNRIW